MKTNRVVKYSLICVHSVTVSKYIRPKLTELDEEGDKYITMIGELNKPLSVTQ